LDDNHLMKATTSVYRSRRFSFRAVVFLLTILSSAQAHPQGRVIYTQPLSTGVRLDPVGDFVDLGSMPLGMALAPDGKRVVAVLSGWREQGIQVVDLESRKVTQTIPQAAAFYGVAFSAGGKALYVSGGNEDLIYAYSWNNGTAALDKKIVLGEKKPDKTGSQHDRRRSGHRGHSGPRAYVQIRLFQPFVG
jgi:DNA-binding beta-propeller fold protein YncE